MFPPHTPIPDAADGQKPASLGFFLENDPVLLAEDAVNCEAIVLVHL